MRTMQLYHRVAVRPCTHGGWKDALTVLFDARRDGISNHEAHRLSLIVPHVARAIEMQRPFRLLQQRYHAVLSMLDRLGIGVLILTGEGDIVAANEASARVLDARDGLERTPQGRLRATDPGTAQRLSAHLQRLAREARLERVPGARPAATLPAVRRRSGAEPYLLDATPFRDIGGEFGTSFAGVLLVLVDPAHRKMVAVHGLVHSYALTPVEAVVCGMLAQGMALRDIADSRGVSLDTIKTQARAIYGKTQTRNRGELVRRALAIAPPLQDAGGNRIN
jgi:DNA-binding CsgD family transcriptional regulator